jgi:hypothetical protein
MIRRQRRQERDHRRADKHNLLFLRPDNHAEPIYVRDTMSWALVVARLSSVARSSAPFRPEDGGEVGAAIIRAL